MKVAVVTELPTPYRAPLYDLLATRGRVAPHVFYLVAREGFRASWSVDCTGHVHEHLRGGALTLRGRHGPFAWKWTRGLVRRLDAAAPDAVVVSGWAHAAMHAAGRYAARRGLPLLLTSESHLRRHRVALRGRLRDLVAGRLVRRASAWLPVSSRATELLVHLGADPARCFVVPNAPDTARLAAARGDEARRRARRLEAGIGPAAPDEPLTVFVGRLIPAKGVDVLLDAAARLPAVPRTVLVGGGPEAERLQARAAALGLGPRVRFVGEAPYAEVVDWMAAADLVALPSVHEPYGVALHEGMAAGAVALTTDAVGAAADLVGERTGEVVAAGDPAALAAAWARLLASPDLAARGRLAAERAHARGLAFAASQVEAAVAAALAASRAGSIGVAT